MKHFFLSIISLLCGFGLCAQNIEFTGQHRAVITETAPASSGLGNIYVLDQLAGVGIAYTPVANASAVQWQKYDLRGATYATDIPSDQITISSGQSILNTVEGDCGYVIIDGSRTTYFWVVDYSSTPYTISSVAIDLGESDCDRTALAATGQAERIVYYGITGRSFELSRDIQVSYTSMIFDEENFRYTTTQLTQSLPYMSEHTYVTAPLCDTYFTIAGDRFLRAWGLETEVTTGHFSAKAIDARTSAVQYKESADNEAKIEDTMGALGGSAPLDVEFTAATTDAAIFTQWQIARDQDFDDIMYRTSDLSFRHTFTDQGMFYVRFIAADASGACEYTSETYTVMIGESRLLCPNVFSPGATEGVNDLWKVSYRSIIEYECYIFNRWGKKLAEFHDPSQGWDGMYGGKPVPAGVYYYVIKARGADGKEYKLSGDINILRYNK